MTSLSVSFVDSTHGIPVYRQLLRLVFNLVDVFVFTLHSIMREIHQLRDVKVSN